MEEKPYISRTICIRTLNPPLKRIRSGQCNHRHDANHNTQKESCEDHVDRNRWAAAIGFVYSVFQLDSGEYQRPINSTQDITQTNLKTTSKNQPQ